MRGATFILASFLHIVSGDAQFATPSEISQPSSGPCHGTHNVVYRGLRKDIVEGFVGIRFANDTSGLNRFKPPVPYYPPPHSIVSATQPGPACPQMLASKATAGFPSAEAGSGPPHNISEDCLRLNVWRPNGTQTDDMLPVLVWIYGGSLNSGYKDEPQSFPGELIRQSVLNGHPIIHVELNYRLGVFGFAQSEALEQEGSENAGLRDQRLAIEWVQQNIGSFGGDASKVTIHGQSSGGTSVGFQVMAYGANKPFPFQRIIAESQLLDVGITGNYTRSAMTLAVGATSCGNESIDSVSTLECLRKLSMNALLNAQLSTATEANVGDEWLPVVDGANGFVPAAPSKLIRQGRIANVTAMVGWCEDDGSLFTVPLSTEQELEEYVRYYLPDFSDANINRVLKLYPVSEFQPSFYPNGSIAFSSQRHRAARIVRDIVFTCQPIHYANAIADAGNSVYFYNQNATLWTASYEADGLYGYGVVHESELLFIYGNLDRPHFPVNITAADAKLLIQEPRTWSTFTALGVPSLAGHDTLQGWKLANFSDPNFGTYVIGGPNAGNSGFGGKKLAIAAMDQEKLQERCAFWNSREIIQQLRY